MSILLEGSSKAEVPLGFSLCQLRDLRRYYADFLWKNYSFRVRYPSLCVERITEIAAFRVRDPSLCAERMTEMIVYDMEA
ncbi:hypothetical protein E2C01_042176 [Portunus trituberculatus]|uniref:Uncharacterized protein n=1 Tax=Portunus trituberculatus TaxID=210409 RepID=A0A5B7FVR9_PORTR|nr:hypothetical protein [Portunus trituberculatus]